MTLKMNEYLNNIVQGLNNWDINNGELFYVGDGDVELRFLLDTAQLEPHENLIHAIHNFCEENELIFHEDSTGTYLCKKSEGNNIVQERQLQSWDDGYKRENTLSNKHFDLELGAYAFKAKSQSTSYSGVYSFDSDFRLQKVSIDNNATFKFLNEINNGKALDADKICKELIKCIKIRKEISGDRCKVYELPERFRNRLADSDSLESLIIRGLNIINPVTIQLTLEIPTTKEAQKEFEKLKQQATKITTQSKNEFLEFELTTLENVHAIFFDL